MRHFIIAISLLLFPVTAETQALGGCKFDKSAGKFEGDLTRQSQCLLKKVNAKGASSSPQAIPSWLSSRIWQSIDLTPAQIDRSLSQNGLRSSLLKKGIVLRPDRDALRYFVIHDTSSPEIPGLELPKYINDDVYNDRLLRSFSGLNGTVNLLIARNGKSRPIVDWGATRENAATKIEQSNMAAQWRSIFVHVENVQPRAEPAGSWAWIAPSPGLTAAQEERLALAYIVASSRAGRWLMPAYHFNIDQGIPKAHDDPQNMDLVSWVGKVAGIHAEIAHQK